MADYGQAVLLPPLLAFLEREAPFVDLAVVNAPNLQELVEDGRIDAALLVGATDRPALRTRELFSDGFVCMVRKGHPTVRQKITLARYLELPHVLVAPTGSPGSIVDGVLAERGKARRIAVSVPSFLVAPLIVSESDFVNTGPERLARRLAGVHPIRLLPAPVPLPRFSIHLTWHARLDTDPSHDWFRRSIERVSETL